MSGKLKTHPADKFCKDLISRFPQSVELADMVRRDRTLITSDCPDWCALPTSFIAQMLAGTGDKKVIKEMHESYLVNELTTALIWTRNKMIYRFDDTIAETLATQSLDCKIPSEIFDYLPYPCVYIERDTTLIRYKTTGFFAWLDWGVRDNKKLLRFLFTRTDGGALLPIIPIIDGTVQDCILDLANYQPNADIFTVNNVRNSPVVKTLLECVNLLLYLSAPKGKNHITWFIQPYISIYERKTSYRKFSEKLFTGDRYAKPLSLFF